MAGNWIAVDHELAETPQVLGLIERTGEKVETIIGRLVLLWSLADRQTTDGVVAHAGLKSLGRQCGGNAKFWQAVVDVGWLVVDEHGASIPRFLERFGESARKRMLDAKRAKLKRLRADDSATGSGRTGDESATVSPRDGDDPAPLQPPLQLQPQLQSEPQCETPTNRRGTGGASKKFTLWKNAKREEFSEPKNVQRVFDLALKAKICNADERFHVFRLVASLVATTEQKDNLPGLLTSILRDNVGKDPWRARGGEHEETAREWIRSLDCPSEMQRRTSDLMPDTSGNELERQRAALLARPELMRPAKPKL